MIPRIPLSYFPVQLDQEVDIENAYYWFRNFISDHDWNNRKSQIEDYLSTITSSDEPFTQSISEGTLLTIQKDQIGWYLFLVHTYLFERHKYEFFQGARVIPVFKRIGTDIKLVKEIKGIDRKVKDLCKKRKSEADSILFEILTALVWKRNGWTVEIIEEGGSERTPDLLVTKDTEQWQVECKRQKKTADYTYRESKKRQDMISQVSKLLTENNILLDIRFHVELCTLPDSYLKDLLQDLVPGIKKPGTIISNEEVEIVLSFVNINSINDHLEKYFVKDRSPQLLELIADKKVDHSSFTGGYWASYFLLGEGAANNRYVSAISNAFGVCCSCDAQEALNAKARDINNLVKDAIKQFDTSVNSIIHVGLETFDGPEVEKSRSEKILNSFSNINTEDNKLCWIFVHYFQSYSRSDMDWYFDETVKPFTSLVYPVMPIPKHFLVIPEDEVSIENRSHWERDLP